MGGLLIRLSEGSVFSQPGQGRGATDGAWNGRIVDPLIREIRVLIRRSPERTKPMSANITTTLNNRFGLAAFWPGQVEAIQNLLAGQHALVVMPTGAGKSLVYQLASLHRPGLTLVISPLIALMQDQVTSLTSRGIPATYINSTLPTSQQNHRLRAMAAGDFELVYVAPERLRSVPFQEALSQVEVGLLAVDEAHSI
jgi:ATP-dependent DNA helicase RecQ